MYVRPPLTPERLEGVMCQAIRKNLGAKMPLHEAVESAGRWALRSVVPLAIRNEKLTPQRIQELLQEVMFLVEDELELKLDQQESIKQRLHHHYGQYLLTARVRGNTLLICAAA